jgi:hypothetical protein
MAAVNPFGGDVVSWFADGMPSIWGGGRLAEQIIQPGPFTSSFSCVISGPNSKPNNTCMLSNSDGLVYVRTYVFHFQGSTTQCGGTRWWTRGCRCATWISRAPATTGSRRTRWQAGRVIQLMRTRPSLETRGRAGPKQKRPSAGHPKARP